MLFAIAMGQIINNRQSIADVVEYNTQRRECAMKVETLRDCSGRLQTWEQSIVVWISEHCAEISVLVQVASASACCTVNDVFNLAADPSPFVNTLRCYCTNAVFWRWFFKPALTLQITDTADVPAYWTSIRPNLHCTIYSTSLRLFTTPQDHLDMTCRDGLSRCQQAGNKSSHIVVLDDTTGYGWIS